MKETVAIYGSKETFIKMYVGKYQTFEFEASSYIGVDELRRQASTNYAPNEQYRAGIVAAQANRHVSAYQTVDVAIVDDKGRLLLGRKPNETKWRFIGGFSDPNSPSLEADARREAQEETGVAVDDVKYIFSTKIEDPRYQNEADCIKTAFFSAKYIFGKPVSNDDIAELKYFTKSEITYDDVIEIHHVLLKKFLEIWN